MEGLVVSVLDFGAFIEVYFTVSGFFWVALIISAIFSGYFALVSNSLGFYRRVQLEEAFGLGSDAAGQLGWLETNLKALSLTCALCRSLANLVIVLSVLELMSPNLNQWAWSIIAALAVAGGIIAIVGVAIPHAWALYGGEKILASSIGVLKIFSIILWPATRLMQSFDLPIRRLSGVQDDDSEQQNENARQEILQAASDGAAEGAVDADEVEMIESVIELGQTQAGEIMTPRTEIFALPGNIPWQKAAEELFQAGHSRVPVYMDDVDHIVGILYAKDLLKNVASDQTPASLKSILRKPYFVPETKLLDDLLTEFRLRKVHIAVILDEYGGTAGLVTIEDILEEIVGEISDEYDLPEPALVTRINEKTCEVDGRIHIDDLNDTMKLKLPEDEDYDTVAGFVFSQLGYIPSNGETLDSCGGRFTIIDANERKISKLRVELITK